MSKSKETVRLLEIINNRIFYARETLKNSDVFSVTPMRVLKELSTVRNYQIFSRRHFYFEQIEALLWEVLLDFSAASAREKLLRWLNSWKIDIQLESLCRALYVSRKIKELEELRLCIESDFYKVMLSNVGTIKHYAVVENPDRVCSRKVAYVTHGRGIIEKVLAGRIREENSTNSSKDLSMEATIAEMVKRFLHTWISPELAKIKIFTNERSGSTVVDIFNVWCSLFLITGFKVTAHSLEVQDDVYKDRFIATNLDSVVECIHKVLIHLWRWKSRSFIRRIVEKSVLSPYEYIAKTEKTIYECDYKTKPVIIEEWRLFILPHHFYLNVCENFFVFMSKEYKQIFDDCSTNGFWRAFSSVLVEQLSSAIRASLPGKFVFQKTIDIKIRLDGKNSDVDFSFFEKRTGTLFVVESKNFLRTHTMFDSLSKDSLSPTSQIRKWREQLKTMAIPFFKKITDSNNKSELERFFGNEDIKIRRIRWVVLTGGTFPWITKDSEDIQVCDLQSILFITKKMEDRNLAGFLIRTFLSFFPSAVFSCWRIVWFLYGIRIKKPDSKLIKELYNEDKILFGDDGAVITGVIYETS